MARSLTRRRFVSHTLASAAALSAAELPSRSQSPAPAGKRRKAVMLGTVRIKGGLREKFQAARAAGFEGVEPSGGLDPNEVLDALRSAGLEAASVTSPNHWKDTLTDPDSATRKRGLEGLLTALRNAKAWGAGSVLLVPGVVNAQVPYDTAWKRSQEGIREAIPLARELEVRISVENVWNYFLLSPLEMARFVDELDSPWVGAHFDIGNALRNGWPEHWIRILGRRINRVHFKEFDVEKMQSQGLRAGFDCDLLAGSNDWKAIMGALDAAGYHGWCISEQRMGLNPADLQKISTAMDQIFALGGKS